MAESAINILGGTARGAASGAAVGGLFGGIGAPVGAGIGGGLGLLGGLFGDDDDEDFAIQELADQEARARAAFGQVEQQTTRDFGALAQELGATTAQGLASRGLGGSPLAQGIITQNIGAVRAQGISAVNQMRLNLERQILGQQGQLGQVRTEAEFRERQETQEAFSQAAALAVFALGDSSIKELLGGALDGFMGEPIGADPGAGAFGNEFA